jgi:hypothetical protein
MSSPIPSAPGDDQLGLRPKPADARPTSVVALSGLLKVQRRWLFAGSTVAAAPPRTPADTPGVLTRLVVVGKPPHCAVVGNIFDRSTWPPRMRGSVALSSRRWGNATWRCPARNDAPTYVKGQNPLRLCSWRPARTRQG